MCCGDRRGPSGLRVFSAVVFSVEGKRSRFAQESDVESCPMRFAWWSGIAGLFLGCPSRRFCSLFYLFKKMKNRRSAVSMTSFFLAFARFKGSWKRSQRCFVPPWFSLRSPCKQAKAAKPSRSDFTPEPLKYWAKHRLWGGEQRLAEG